MNLPKVIKDIVEITGKTLISTIPFGGACATAIYDTVKGNVLQKRKEKWMSVIEKRIGSLEISLDDLGNNENFTTMLIKTTEIAMKTQKEEKLNYLASALKNSINSNLDEDRMVIFMDLLEKYTVSHLKILSFCNMPEQYKKEEDDHKVIDNDTINLLPFDYLKAFHEKNPKIKPIFYKCYKDLYNDGLLIESMPDSTNKKKTTFLGKAFLNFIITKE